MRTSARDLLARLNEHDEHPRSEAKTASELGKSAMQTVVAYANEPGLDGGYLLLGVERGADGVYRPVGVRDPDRIQADLASQCASMVTPPIRPLTWVEEIEGVPVVGVYVPELPSGAKPAYFTATGLPKGAWRRIGSTDQRCTDEDVRELHSLAREASYDRTAVPGGGLGDIDPQALMEYRRRRGAVNPAAEELGWTDEQLLEGVGAVVAQGGVLVPTVAGILLFGTRSAIRRLFPTMRIDYVRLRGKEWIDDPENRYQAIDIRDNLFAAIRKARAAIQDDLPAAFSLPGGDIQRSDRRLLPEDVIREAVVNAVMHRRYTSTQPIQIIRYSNRLEIRNPGRSLKPEEALGQPGSVPRNPAIASVLHDTNLAETKGSGIRAMRQLMDRAELSPPTFESSRSRDEFVATFLFHHLLDESEVAWLSGFGAFELSGDDLRALAFARETGSIGNSDYRDLNRVDTLTASSRIRRLREHGLLQPTPQGGTPPRYQLTGRALQLGSIGLSQLGAAPESGDGADAAAPISVPSSEGISVTPGKTSVTSEGISVTSEGNSVTSAVDGYGDGASPGGGPPGDPYVDIVRTRSKPSAKVVRRAILSLCAGEFRTLREIAEALGRDPVSLRIRHVSAMVKAGALELRHPESPNHRDQAYRAAGKSRGA
jgi:ATP-dependent DNA helicase RecG